MKYKNLIEFLIKWMADPFDVLRLIDESVYREVLEEDLYDKNYKRALTRARKEYLEFLKENY